MRERLHRLLFPNDLSPHVWRRVVPWWSLLLNAVAWVTAVGALTVFAWKGLDLSGVWIAAAAALVPGAMSSSLHSQLTKTDRQRLIDLSLTPDGPAMWVLSRVRIAQVHALALSALLTVAMAAVTLRHGGLPGINLRPALEIALALVAMASGLCFALVMPTISAFSALQALTPQEVLARRVVFGCAGFGSLCLLMAVAPIILVAGPCVLFALIACIGQWRLARVELPLQANSWARTQAERVAEGQRTPWYAKRLW